MTPKEHFDRFKGHWFDASFLDEGLDGNPVWDNPRDVLSRDIDWLAFLSNIPLPQELCEGIALEMERLDPPLMLVLPHLVKSIVESVHRSQDAPGFQQVAAQLALLRTAAMRLADIAQGGNGKGTPTAKPEWWKYDTDDVYRKHIELGLRVQDGRSAFLHPLLQDHLTMAISPQAYALIQPNEPDSDEELRKAHQSLTHFFKHLHALLPVIENAETITKQLADQSARQRRSGKPEDVARNWLLVRLMWLWRDVLGSEPTIYLLKTRDRVELDEPEPQGCMAFVVANLAHVDPVTPGEYPSLERHLQSLRSAIPTTSLLRMSSRAN
jgi:hypothetical protein